MIKNIRIRESTELENGQSFFRIYAPLKKNISIEIDGNNKTIELNKNWKNSISLSKTVNQNFVGIPFYRMLNMLAYKCKRLGINFVLQEESYTSKCDALAFESIEKHETYKGSRIKRGLFKSSVGKLINADINGALNILRKFLNTTKETSEFSVLQKIIGSGLVLSFLSCRK